ncbi:hypothetical protein YC2023_107603 [Brassica napus]
MAKALDFLSDLQNSRSSSTVQVSLLRFWDARNVRRGGDLMGVDMLLLDSQTVKRKDDLETVKGYPKPGSGTVGPYGELIVGAAIGTSNGGISVENLMLRQQLEAIVQENSLLKQAVVKQQKWQRETEDQSQELQPLRQLFT